MLRRGLCLLLILWLTGCESLFFFPSRPLQHTPAELGLQYQDVSFAAADGTQLHGWFLPAQGVVKGTVLHLHGNAANIGDHVWAVRWLPPAGYQVLTFDYRGYGRSQGQPSLAGVQQDIDAALGFLLQRADVEPKQVMILAQSLGGAMGIYNLAHSPWRSQVKLLVVDSAFSSYQGIAREKMAGWWLTWPLQWMPYLLLSDRYAPQDAVAELSPIPLILIHGSGDRVVPAHHSEQLYAAAGAPKELWLLPNVPHTAGLELPANRQRLLAMMARALGAPDASQQADLPVVGLHD
ncbi:MAG: alpha/beta fold hydrolase [Chitinivorax sp.]|jgi:fermentation-respiration switch protein FrsA (DUF1100 family)